MLTDCFFPTNLFFHFKSFLIIFDWLEKGLDRKPAPIEMIMYTGYQLAATHMFKSCYKTASRSFLVIFRLTNLENLFDEFFPSLICTPDLKV